MQRPSAWVALGSGIVAIVAGLLALPYGYYSKLKESADLSQKYSKLQADYLQQVSDMTQLQLRQSEKQAKDLAGQIAARNKTITDLNRSKDQLNTAIGSLQQRVRNLGAEAKRLDATRLTLEQQVGTLSRTAAYSRLQASISDSSTQLAQLLTTRIRAVLDPEQQPKGPRTGVQDVYEALQDNVNYIALARSLLTTFEAPSGTNPLEQGWTFTYSMADFRPVASGDDIAGTLRVISMLRLLPIAAAGLLKEAGVNGRGHRYLQVTGGLTTSLKNSPFFGLNSLGVFPLGVRSESIVLKAVHS